MEKSLDFNSVKKPTLNLTMKDEAKTKIRVTVPNQSLIEELQSVVPALQEIAARDSSIDSINAVFDLAARLISCNRDFINVTADDLRGRFSLDIEDVIPFFSAYIGFIEESSKAKN